MGMFVVVLLVTFGCFRRGRRGHGLVMVAIYLVSLALSADLSRALNWSNGALGIFSGLLSGNALVAATAFGAAALLLTLDRPRWRWPAALLAATVVLLVGWARIVRDGDLPSGVLAGLAVSALLLLFGTFVIEAMELRVVAAPAAPAAPAPREPPEPGGPGSGRPAGGGG